MKQHHRHRRSRTVLGVSSALLVLGLLAACGKNADPTTPSTIASAAASGVELPADIVEAAKKEGTVTVYSGTPDFAKVVKAFEKKYGIRATDIQLGGTEIAQRYLAEADSGRVQADVFTTTDIPLITDHPQYFVPITDELLPNVAKFDKLWRMERAFEWYSLPVGINYNTNLIPANAVPQTWKDLLKPEYKGKICYNDPRGSNGARNLLKTLAVTQGPDFLRALADQNLRIVPGNTAPGAQAVAAGDCGIAVPGYPGRTVNDLKARGAPIIWKPLTEPGIYSPGKMLVSAKAPHPNAARLLANFVASAEAAAILCNGVTVSVPSDPKGTAGCQVIPASPAFLDTTGTEAEINGYLDILRIK